jgi:hypothetical protein
MRRVGGSPAVGVTGHVGGSGTCRATGRASSTDSCRRWGAGRSSGGPAGPPTAEAPATGAAAGRRAGGAGTRCFPAPLPSGRRGAGTTGTRVVSPPSTVSPTGRGLGVTAATRCVSASVTGSSTGPSPSVIVQRCGGRPFVHAATPAVRASLPMRSPSPTAGPVVATPRDRTPHAPRQSRVHLTCTCQRHARPRFTNRRQSLGRTRNVTSDLGTSVLSSTDKPRPVRRILSGSFVERCAGNAIATSRVSHVRAREIRRRTVFPSTSEERAPRFRCPTGHNRRGERPRQLIVIRRQCVTQVSFIRVIP